MKFYYNCTNFHNEWVNVVKMKNEMRSKDETKNEKHLRLHPIP